jgi:hypothetical protein
MPHAFLALSPSIMPPNPKNTTSQKHNPGPDALPSCIPSSIYCWAVEYIEGGRKPFVTPSISIASKNFVLHSLFFSTRYHMCEPYQTISSNA